MKSLILFLLLSLALLPAATAHQHYAVGVIDQNGNSAGDQGEALQLVNFPAPGHVFPLVYDAQYPAGLWVLTGENHSSFTFAVRSGDPLDPQPLHPALGSTIYMEITSITGPSGAQFGFWDVTEDGQPRILTFNTPTASFETNQPTGGFSFILSEQTLPADAGDDPYGHIHDRAWSVDQPGDYEVTFVLHDLSTNGTDGGPIHASSQPYTFHFRAIPEPGAGVLLLAAATSLGLWTRRRR